VLHTDSSFLFHIDFKRNTGGIELLRAGAIHTILSISKVKTKGSTEAVSITHCNIKGFVDKHHS
jgi:hypothetical protein